MLALVLGHAAGLATFASAVYLTATWFGRAAPWLLLVGVIRSARKPVPRPWLAQTPFKDPWFLRSEASKAIWLLGGHRKRLVIEALADAPEAGIRAEAVAADGSVGRATAFEAFRALRAVGALEHRSGGAYRLDEDDDLGSALLQVVRALRRRGNVLVDRPPSRRP